LPEISRFYGIVIAMFFNEHAPPHFHARYGDDKIAVEIETLKVLEGSIAPRALGLVMEWASQHKGELMHDWDMARNQKAPGKIEPLK